MQVRTRHTPSFGVARLVLAPGEPVRISSGTMLATSYGVTVEEHPQGGVLKSFARAALGSGATRVATCTAPQQGGWVDVVPNLPGDLNVIEFDGGTGWCVAEEAWLAAATTTQSDSRWNGFTGLFGGEEGFLTHVTGQGPVVVTCYGALDVLTLQPGELVTVDTAHVVAYADTVRTRLRQRDHSRGAQSGAQSLSSGEGLVFDFAGPGQVLTQTRSPRGLVSWLQSSGLGGR